MSGKHIENLYACTLNSAIRCDPPVLGEGLEELVLRTYYEYGEHIELVCQPRYNLPGTPDEREHNMTCEISGDWDYDPTPTCVHQTEYVRACTDNPHI